MKKQFNDKNEGKNGTGKITKENSYIFSPSKYM